MAKRWFLMALATLGLATQAIAQGPMAMPLPPSAPMAPTGPMGPISPIAPSAPMPLAGPMGPMGPMGPIPMQPMPPMGPMGPMPPMGPMGPMGMQPPAAPVSQPTFANDPGPPASPEFCPGPGDIPKDDSLFGVPTNGVPNAFDEECKGCNQGMGFLVNIGALGLRRETLNSTKFAFLDRGALQPNGTVLFHTGALPPPGSPAIIDSHDIAQDMRFGVRASVQCREDDYGFELAGFYIGPRTRTTDTTIPAHLTLGFALFPIPAGFRGNNDLFTDADHVQLNNSSTIWSGEANFRCKQNDNFEWILGVRYMDFKDSFGIFVDNSSLETGIANPTLLANYNVHTQNRIVAPQLGFETEWGLIRRLAIGATLKGAWGVDFDETTVSLTRGDGLAGPGIHHSSTVFSQVYEASLFADILITEQIMIRLGYQALWLVGIPEAQQQVNFNLTNPGGNLNNHGSIFFQGPMAELRLVF
jgi:hypothetical protein